MSLKQLCTLDGHTAPVRVVRSNLDGSYCLSGGYDKLIILWNPHSDKLIKEFKGHGYQVMDITIAHDNSTFVSCGGDKQPFFWDVARGVVVHKFKGHSQQVNAVSFNKDASIVASASYDQTAKIWDCRSWGGDAIQVLEGAADSVTGVLFTDNEIYTSSVDGCVRTYDIRKGELRTDHVAIPLTSLSLSYSGRLVLLSCLDSTIKVLDTSNGTLYQQYKGHKNSEFRLDSTFFMDDQFVVSGSEDGDLFIWDTDSANVVIHQKKAHHRMISGISKAGANYLLSASSDTTIKFWEFSTSIS